MHRLLPKLLLVLLSLLSIDSMGAMTHQPHEPEVKQVDLSQKRWGQGDAFSLEGEWSFAWHHLDQDFSQLKPGDIKTTQTPGSWEDTSQGLSGHGYGTLALDIVVPKSLSTSYLYLPDMASAYELWVNGEKVQSRGTVGTEKALESPEYGPSVSELSPEDGRLEIRIITSNFHYQWGGIWYPPLLTDDSGVFDLRESPYIQATLASTLLISTGVLSLLMFLSRPGDRKVLFFSLLCFTIGIRRLLIEERILHEIDWLPWHFLQFAENVSIYLMLPLLLSYLRYLFPREFSPILVKMGWMVAVPFIGAAALLEVSTYTRFNVPFQIISLAFAPSIFFLYLKALKAKRRGAKLFGYSLIIFTATVVNDVLNYSYIISTPNLMHIGTLAFVMFQLGGLINRYLKNFKTIERLSDDLKKQNQELAQIDAYKDDFLAATSHEFRTPLHSISALTRLITKDSATLSPSQHQSLALIDATSTRLNALVNDLLDASSIKHRKVSLNVKSLEAQPLVKAVVNSMKPLLAGKPVALAVKANAVDDLRVLADEQRLHQVLVNILGNAIKHTQQGEISVALERANEQIIFKITDTGSGIEASKIDALFTPFEQLSESGGRFREGSGLGLSISKELIELQNGTITLESKLGHGTTVELTLPVDQSSAKPSSDVLSAEDAYVSFEQDKPISANGSSPDDGQITEATSNENQATSKLIYYADDEAINREVVEGFLNDEAFSVKTFPSAPLLLEALSYLEPDLILMDLMMPEMDGITACRKIREQHHSAKLPIVMLTARHQNQDIIDALHSGANDYLTKPYNEHELIARINAQLSVKALWIREKENHALKSQLLEKERLKAKLEKANQGLKSAIDTNTFGTLVLDLNLNIEHANAAASELFETPTSAMEQENLLSFLLESDEPIIDKTLKQTRQNDNAREDQNHSELLLTLRGAQKSLRAELSSPSSDTVVISFEKEAQEKEQRSQKEVFNELLAELSKSREKIEQIEQTIAHSDLSLIEPTPPVEINASNNSPTNSEVQDAPELIVKTMRMSLSVWERHAKKTKVDLAEQSRLWSVYLDGNSAKTRTLDKYLSVKTLPAKPRWRSVINTAKFVLEQCELPQDEREQLDQLADQIDQHFS